MGAKPGRYRKEISTTFGKFTDSLAGLENRMAGLEKRMARIEETLIFANPVARAVKETRKRNRQKRVIPKGYVTVADFVDKYRFTSKQTVRSFLNKKPEFFLGFIDASRVPIYFDALRMVEAFEEYIDPKSHLGRTFEDYRKMQPAFSKLCKKLKNKS